MRFTVVTVGSEGDTRPLAALCRGLLDRGHELTLFADAATLGWPRALGIPCQALEGDMKTVLPGADVRQGVHFVELMKAGRNLKAHVRKHTTGWLRMVAEHAVGADAVLFSSLALSVGLILRDELHIPLIGLAFQPFGAPTREFPSPGLPPLKLPGWANFWTHKVMLAQLWRMFAKSTVEARRAVFGKTVTAAPAFAIPTLYGVSRVLVPQPSDWPADHVICGHWSRPADDWQPPRDLLEFVSGEPPMYAGFGSPSVFFRARTLRALTTAVAGRRVVFSPGWSNIDRSLLPDNFFIARDVPHEWLFPRMSLAIHHGGAGTTHTAARAGVPQIILPFGADQFFWAGRVAALGIGPRSSARLAGNATALATMIDLAQEDFMRRKARELGKAMACEDGVLNAASRIETLVTPP